MADIKRDIFNKNRTISETQQKVVFQAGKPLLNYELNLLQDIQSEKIKDLTKLSVGNNYTGDSFKVLAQTSPLTISVNKGTFYHKGFPVVLEGDIDFSGLTSALAPRTDNVFVEWSIDEITASDDPNIKDSAIGFETTRQLRVVSLVKAASGSDATPTTETITFDNASRSISLLNSKFPDWMKIVGTRFFTSSLNNEMASSSGYEVESSPSDNVIILKTGTVLTNEVLSYAKFYEHDITHPNTAQKEFIAYRKNFFPIASISRTVGTTILSGDITDLRDSVVYNFVKTGCNVVRTSSSTISVSEGEVFVGDVNYNINTVSYSIGSGLVDNKLNFVYVDNSGNVQTSLTEPTSSHLMLAEVKVKGGKLWGIEDNSLVGLTNFKAIEDVREFSPIAWNFKYGDEGGTGETGFTSLVLKFRADTNIGNRSLVYASSSNGISPADPTFVGSKKVPAIGMTTQSISANSTDNVLIIGEIESSSWSFTPGAILYAGSVGTITQTPTTSQGTHVQRVGVAITSTRAFIKPDNIFIKNNKTSGEASLISLNPNGDLEVVGYAAKFNTDRSSFLAPVATAETGSTSTTFDILPGRYFLNDSDNYNFSIITVNMGIGGNFQTSGIPSNDYNKAFFTLGDDLLVHKYEGISNPTASLVVDPTIPSNEMPICVVLFRGIGSMTPGDIQYINQTDITDKRNWLNLGSLDDSAFKPVYRDATNFIVQKGSGWFNTYYITLASNQTVSATTSVVSSKYIIYFDLNTASGGTAINSDFVTMLYSVKVDKRRYIPIGEYFSAASTITVGTFKTYSSKFWMFRDPPYAGEQTFSLSTPASSFTLTNFNFLVSDFLDVAINGRRVYEIDDYTKTVPASVNFKYNVKTGAVVKIRRI